MTRNALALLRTEVAAGKRPLRITTHAQVEAAKDGLLLADLREVFETGDVIEAYSQEQRWLLHGQSSDTGLPIHIVVEDTEEAGIVVTAYVPDRSIWLADRKRSHSGERNDQV